jgi:DNA-binding response OmpR family regulator
MKSIEGNAVSPLQADVSPALVRLAVIDADSGFTRVLVNRLGPLGWRAQVLTQPPSVRDLTGMRIDALVIDLALVAEDGWSYLEEVARTCPTLALIVCSSQSTVAQRVRGLRLGADDWVTKPCHPEEMLARLEAALRRRRSGKAEAQEPVVAGELEIRPDMFEAFVGGQPIGLTRREFELLQTLARAGGVVVPREGIYQQVWGYTMVHGDRSVDVFVRRLRKKLETASPGWAYLHTHFGVGYRFDPEEANLEDI